VVQDIVFRQRVSLQGSIALQNNWTQELSRLFWLLAGCIVVGWMLDIIWLALAAGSLIYITWNLNQLKRVHDWLISDTTQDPPESVGLWGAVCDKIYYLQKEQQLTRSELEREVAYLRDSFASLTDSAVMINNYGMIDWCNDAAIRNLGFRFPEDYGQHVLNLLRDPGFVRYYEKNDYGEGIEMPAPIDSERLLFVQITRFGQGNRLLFARDITEIHKLEEMRRDFVSNVSHELRTPLTVINGYIDNFGLLADEEPRLKKPLKQMSQNSQRMEHLLRDLLELSRLETLPNEMHKTEVSLSDMAVVVVEEARASISEDQARHISVQTEGDVKIFGQQTEVHSALLNLVINACKYTHNEGVIDVHCWQDEQGAHFSVTDDGIGIDPLTIPRLTERFYRVDKSRSINTGGTGLGLAIVKHILQRHEAELDITSTPGKGSCFTCHFAAHRLVLPLFSSAS